MRNAAATFDDDFELSEPARKKATRRPSPGAKKKKGKRRFSFKFDMIKVARYAAIGMSATVALGIMVNALVLQKSRHPAPLFGKSIALGEAQPAPRPAVKAVVIDHATPDVPIEAPLPVSKPTIASLAEAATSGSSDQIAQLLQGGAIPSERPDPKTVVAAQRALAKLGFGVKPTGTFGPQTRKALELFEKEHHLPIKGELSRRVIKILAAESKLKPEH